MNLHENKKLFTDAVLAASEYLDIRPVYIEKDYWITRSLKLMTQNSNADKAIFKGGTSLSKAHKIGNRFSEDIDIAISDADVFTGNQLKMLIKRIANEMTAGLDCCFLIEQYVLMNIKKDLTLLDFYFEYDERGFIDIEDELFHCIRSEFTRLNKGNAEEYLVTQYLSSMAQYNGFDGIRFRSSLVYEGTNYVIFDNENCDVVCSKMYIIPAVQYTLQPILNDDYT